MKVKMMAEQMDEYKRLKGLADTIAECADALNTPILEENGTSAIQGTNNREQVIFTTVQFSGTWATVKGGPNRLEYQDVKFSGNVTDYLRDDLVKFLRDKVKELRAHMDAMEIE